EHREVDVLALDRRDRGESGGRGHDLVTSLLQRRRDELRETAVVVGDQDDPHHGRVSAVVGGDGRRDRNLLSRRLQSFRRTTATRMNPGCYPASSCFSRSAFRIAKTSQSLLK